MDTNKRLEAIRAKLERFNGSRLAVTLVDGETIIVSPTEAIGLFRSPEADKTVSVAAESTANKPLAALLNALCE